MTDDPRVKAIEERLAKYCKAVEYCDVPQDRKELLEWLDRHTMDIAFLLEDRKRLLAEVKRIESYCKRIESYCTEVEIARRAAESEVAGLFRTLETRDNRIDELESEVATLKR